MALCAEEHAGADVVPERPVRECYVDASVPSKELGTTLTDVDHRFKKAALVG